jgi:threonine dehydratase
MISAAEIEGASERLKGLIHCTPVFRSQYLDRLLNTQLFIKAENLQKTGSFKARGALNSVLALAEEKKQKGVATHSSGNHGQALAWAAGRMGIPAYIVMPENAPAVIAR